MNTSYVVSAKRKTLGLETADGYLAGRSYGRSAARFMLLRWASNWVIKSKLDSPYQQIGRLEAADIMSALSPYKPQHAKEGTGKNKMSADNAICV